MDDVGWEFVALDSQRPICYKLCRTLSLNSMKKQVPQMQQQHSIHPQLTHCYNHQSAEIPTSYCEPHMWMARDNLSSKQQVFPGGDKVCPHWGINVHRDDDSLPRLSTASH